MDGNEFAPLPSVKGLPVYHIQVMSKLDELTEDLKGIYAEYRFGEIAQRLYEFLWNDFCDKWLEAVKGDLRESATAQARAAALGTFDAVMSRYLQLLHPYMPHVTEELSERMNYVLPGEFLMGKSLPANALLAELSAAETEAARKQATAIYETAGRLRNLKAEYNLGSRKDVRFVMKGAVAWLPGELSVLALLAGSTEILVDDSYEAPKGTPAAVTAVGEAYMPMEGLIDVEAERIRISKEIEKIRIEVTKSEGKLGNPAFADRAPAEVVAQEKLRLEDWKTKLAQLGEMLDALK
jgi:valyl-tRNA synthetase